MYFSLFSLWALYYSTYFGRYFSLFFEKKSLATYVFSWSYCPNNSLRTSCGYS
jgi:hypothetical protein